MEDDTESKSVTDKFSEIFEFNTAIVNFTREKVVEVQALAELHRQVAGKYDEISIQLMEVAAESAQLIGDALVAEMGLGGEGEDEEEGEEDD